MRLLILSVLVLGGMQVMAEELVETGPDRDPASVISTSTKRTYPGAADEEDLAVQARIPEAAIRVDARTVQRTVFKTLYNQDLKDQSQEQMEE